MTPHSQAPGADSLRFTLHAPNDARAGEPVALTLRLTNRSHRPIDAYFLGREIAFDIVVAREDGAVVWRRLEGAVVPSVLQVRTLAPGETLELKDVWTPPAPGRYTAWALLPRDAPEPRRTPVVPLRVRAP